MQSLENIWKSSMERAEKHMKKLGIIGGMGPLATQLLYKEIVEHTKAQNDREHIDMLIINHASMPDRTDAIRTGKTAEVFNLLLKDAKFLEKNGMGVIAIPCNTSHYFYDKLQEQISIPIINMISAAVEAAKKSNPALKKIGILATDGTIFSGIYKKECEKVGLEYYAPDEIHQKLVMNIIYEQIKKGLRGSDEDFKKIHAHLISNKCDAAILACTELSCFAKENGVSGFYTDALDALRDCAIISCGAELR